MILEVLKCLFGFHTWHYWIRTIPAGTRHGVRTCLKCHKYQHLTEQKWISEKRVELV